MAALTLYWPSRIGSARRDRSREGLPKQVEIFTDGACRGNPGPGGWGVLPRQAGVERTLYGGRTAYDQQSHELMVAIEGLSKHCANPAA